MKLRVLIFWTVGTGLLVLGALGYAEAIWGLRVANPLILLALFVTLTLADRLLTRHLEAKAEARTRQFRIIASTTIASKGDRLQGLAWDGEGFWFTGAIDGKQGVFRLGREFAIEQSVVVPDAFPYAVIARDDLIVLLATADRYEARQYTKSGTLLHIMPVTVGLRGMPACFASNGEQYWLAIDEANMIYVLSSEFTVLRDQPLPHRLLGATYARNRLWMTDAYRLYEYDRNLKLGATYPYPGTTCRGIAFDRANLWSLDGGPKRLHKHLVV